MKKKYTKRQIQESIKYWQKQLNEASAVNSSKDTLVDNLKQLDKEIAQMETAYEKASDEEVDVINKVFAWQDTSTMLSLIISNFYKLIGVKYSS